MDLPSMETMMLDRASGLTAGTADEVRIATIVDGRGRAGKTTVANVFVQFCRERGANLRVWNADRQNETHSLSVFHRDAVRPPSDDPDDKGAWLEESFDAQVRERFDSVLDLAGGDPLVRPWPVRPNWSPLWSSIGSGSCSGRYSAPMSRISII